MRKKIIILLISAAVVAMVVLLVRKRSSGAGEDEDEDEGQSLVTVSTGRIVSATLHGYVDAYGSIMPAPAGNGQPPAEARVASAVAGVLARTYVTEGESVERGQRLFDLDDRVAVAALERARRLAAVAEAALDRQRRLFQAENSSAKAVQDAEAQAASAQADLATARTELAWTHISAPLSGVVSRIDVRPGEAVDTTAPLAEVVDLHRLVVSTEIPSRQARAVRPGQAVSIVGTPAAKAEVDYVSPVVDPASDTVVVRARLISAGGLRPGQYVQLRILTEVHPDVLAAPAESVVTDEAGKSVIALVSGEEAEQKEVKVGLRDDHLVEVAAPGLKAGDTVVTTGAYGLPEKTKISVAR